MRSRIRKIAAHYGWYQQQFKDFESIPNSTGQRSSRRNVAMLPRFRDNSVVWLTKKCSSPGGGIDRSEIKPIEANHAFDGV